MQRLTCANTSALSEQLAVRRCEARFRCVRSFGGRFQTGGSKRVARCGTRGANVLFQDLQWASAHCTADSSFRCFHAGGEPNAREGAEKRPAHYHAAGGVRRPAGRFRFLVMPPRLFLLLLLLLLILLVSPPSSIENRDNGGRRKSSSLRHTTRSVTSRIEPDVRRLQQARCWKSLRGIDGDNITVRGR